MSMTATDARRRLFPLIQKVNDDQLAVEIISKNGTAFLVPEDEYRSLLETAFLLRSPSNARWLLKGIEEHRAHQAEVHELIEPTDEE